MATPLPVPNVCRATFHQLANDRPYSNSIYLKYSGDWSNADGVLLSGDLMAAWVARIEPSMAANQSIEEVVVEDLADPLHPATSTTAHHGGGGSGDVVPVNVTMQAYLTVASRVRGGRSSLFLTGFSLGDIETANVDTWDPTRVSAVQTGLEDMASDITGTVLSSMGSLQWGTVHRSRYKALLDPPQFEQFVDIVVRGKIHGRTRRLGR